MYLLPTKHTSTKRSYCLILLDWNVCRSGILRPDWYFFVFSLEQARYLLLKLHYVIMFTLKYVHTSFETCLPLIYKMKFGDLQYCASSKRILFHSLTGCIENRIFDGCTYSIFFNLIGVFSTSHSLFLRVFGTCPKDM
jgi:hypothetical protein